MSELSTVAIKDGHRGHLHHHNHYPMDAERADRISRLAGLDRVAQPRGAPVTTSTAGGSIDTNTPQRHAPTQAYFDSNNTPQMTRERSTVGSASATGSVGGRTTWASGSNDGYDPDKMSEDMDVDASSTGGFSDEGTASLVGFGEGARTPARQLSGIGSPTATKASLHVSGGGAGQPSGLRQQVAVPGGGVEAQKQNAKMIDGMTYDKDVVDTSNRTPPLVDE
jgi:hypothetical protein